MRIDEILTTPKEFWIRRLEDAKTGRQIARLMDRVANAYLAGKIDRGNRLLAQATVLVMTMRIEVWKGPQEKAQLVEVKELINPSGPLLDSMVRNLRKT